MQAVAAEDHQQQGECGVHTTSRRAAGLIGSDQAEAANVQRDHAGAAGDAAASQKDTI